MKPHVFQFDQAKADAVDTTDAVRLLEALRHPDEPIWLQSFADGPDTLYLLEQKTAKSGRPYTVKRWKVTGIPKAGGKTSSVQGFTEKTGNTTLEQMATRPYLLENMARAGVFFCVNVLAEDAPRRKAKHVTRVAAVFLDLDGTPMPEGLPLVPTATIESSAGRHHVYWAVDGIPLDEFPVIQKHLAGLYSADPAVHDLSRVMRLPGYWHGKDEPGQLVRLTSLQPDAQYTRDDLLQAFPGLADALAAATAERERRAQDAERRKVAADELVQSIKSGTAGTLAEVHRKYGEVTMLGLTSELLKAGIGERNTKLNWVAFRAGQLIGGGLLDEVEVRAEFTDIALQIGLERSETEATLSSGLSAGKDKPLDASQLGKALGVKKARVQVDRLPPPTDTTPAARKPSYRMPTFPKGTQEGTDEANALILSKNGLADLLRYSMGAGWFVYDPGRGAWARDPDLILAVQVAGEVLREVVGQYFADAVKQRADEEELSRIGRWASGVCNTRTVKNALIAAAGKREFLTPIDAWDARPELLNCLNGVLEVTTGVLRPHLPSDLLTWQTGAAFDPQAQHPYVDQLTELLKLDGRHDFLQRSLGSTLYGENPNEVFTVLQGAGGTGKGTLIAAITAALGDYAGTVEVELLLDNARGETGSGPKPELLMLRGKRLVVAGEPKKGARFNAGRVKGMTGNDPITARGMRSDVMVTFKPVFKLFIHTNYEITASHDDSGLQRRIRVVPFTAKPATADDAFKSTLSHDHAARSAILNWMLEGCRAWLHDRFNLGESAAIEEATEGYWKDQNPYEKFAQERLVLDHRASIRSGQLKAAFENWAEENGYRLGRAVKMAELYAFLKQHGCESRHTKEGNLWDGVELMGEGGEPGEGTSPSNGNLLTREISKRTGEMASPPSPPSPQTRDDVAARDPGWVGEDL
ncbi:MULTISPECIES: phage/plasmid primase, P4 family [Deinococcus]|uniref:Phage/plasmid primase, P4 family n=1 Tax=Deinococcus rufus TaxID=2136097 RepID=A0ABV7ZB12_9DEIO|nr:phage/plasmid primase, P4 family [Deinococcus sp. AB2017081]WQE97451.1 phage/plasmid primase, P4 family [Deinococcus sp. AB2017081]WQE97474.1 phage/plasmid primase, P4 family [Deinococcus sp. AB2017081]